jgi:ribosomal-protein-alanine N-acetyltransferase
MGVETEREHAGATIRALGLGDVQAVAAIGQVTPEAANWTEESYREALSWVGVVPLVCEHAGRITSFVIGRQVSDEAEILNVAVARSSRRKGQGAALLEAALREFRARRVSQVFLEVRESNETGIAFYEKQGFSRTARRSNYFRDPDEAAIVMETKLRD